MYYDYDDLKLHRPLRRKKKIYEFYTAPITKFWADSVRKNSLRMPAILG